jgi:DNA-binding response OmpR family regulator
MPSGNPLLAPILVVDDSAANVRLLIRVLERGGYTEVTGITDPRSVPDYAKEIAPRLIILDLHMPHVDGLAVIREIRTTFRDIPKFLVVTGNVEEGIRSLALARGADDVLTKPFQMDDVLRRVRLLLEVDDHPTGGRCPEG